MYKNTYKTKGGKGVKNTRKCIIFFDNIILYSSHEYFTRDNMREITNLKYINRLL